MSEELQKPPVLDIDALLQPIEGENPSGESLRYSGIYDEISEARRADLNVAQGEWKADLKVADFNRVIGIAVPVLTSQSKDLQIAAWLTEALVNRDGFVGLRDGLRLLSKLQENFWDTLHPEIDEGDMEGRANAISWIESQAALALTRAPITDGEGYSFTDWLDSTKFFQPDDFDSLDSATQESIRQLMAQAEAEHRVTGDKWARAKRETRRAFCEELNFLLDECQAAVKELDRVNEEKYDRKQLPGLTTLQSSLEKVHEQVRKLLEEKRLEEPDAEVPSDEAEAAGGEGGGGAASNGGSGGGQVANRRDALLKLAEIASFFQRTEPHSPVSHLVNRAVRWGNMPLESWLQDVIKDENVLYQLRQTLGINNQSDSGGTS
jgi:type VI secretion system protein ImpA